MKNTNCLVCPFKAVHAQGLHQHVYKQSKNNLEHKKLYESQLVIVRNNYKNLNKLEDEKNYLFDLNFAELYLRTTNLYTFKCEGCGLNFRDKFSLTLHLKKFVYHTDEKHKEFIENELKKIDEYIKQDYKYQELYDKTVLPDNVIRKILQKSGKIKCEACDKTFADNQAYGNHLKVHPKIIDKYKQFVISLFDSDLSATEIENRYNLPLSFGWIGDVYEKEFGKDKLKERVCRINKLSLEKQYANGREGWNKGLNVYTDKRVAKARTSIAKAHRKRMKDKGIVQGKQMMDEFEKYEFKKNKQIIKKQYHQTCQACRKDFSNMKKQLACHHIVPFRLSRNNFLSNLTPLCHTCHNKLEKNLNNIETKQMSFNEKCDLYIKGYQEFIK